MAFVVNNTILDKIFVENKPIRTVFVAQKDGTGKQRVFDVNPLRLTIQVTTTSSTPFYDNRRLVITNDTPYTEKIKLDFTNVGRARDIPPTIESSLSLNNPFIFDYSVLVGMATIEFDLTISVWNEKKWVSSQTPYELRGQNPYTAIFDCYI